MTPEEADKAQQWAGMHGATAWHLIDRNADNWNEVGEMMNAWLRANGGGQWVACADRLPDDKQAVAFVVKAANLLAYMDGRVLGGNYQAGPCGGFSVPGLQTEAHYWRPLPAAPPNAGNERTPLAGGPLD